jgi:hypothetical protein
VRETLLHPPGSSRALPGPAGFVKRNGMEKAHWMQSSVAIVSVAVAHMRAVMQSISGARSLPGARRTGEDAPRRRKPRTASR